MRLLVDTTELELLLEKNRDRIGHSRVEGTDTLFSGITFILSTVFAEYTSLKFISGSNIKVICVIIGITFSVRG